VLFLKRSAPPWCGTLGDDFADNWEIRARDEQLPPAAGN